MWFLWVFTVPMRNWNLRMKSGRVKKYGSFLQYLWGIETWKYHNFLLFHQYGFYSTYEELKQKSQIYIIQQKASFYSTYEELKLDEVYSSYKCSKMFLQYLWGIETYTNVRWYVKPHTVFTVPMRNWNSLRVIKENSGRYEFLQYLWGIETPPFPNSFIIGW